jgi:hypothetical protein
MDWKKERDLLIAQTLAFVQSVTGKNEDSGEPARALGIDLAPNVAAVAAPAPTEAMRNAIEIAQQPVIAPPVVAPVPKPAVAKDFRTEIQERVANFRAHQERFHREREAHFSTTLAKLRADIRNDSTPSR